MISQYLAAINASLPEGMAHTDACFTHIDWLVDVSVAPWDVVYYVLVHEGMH